MKHVELDRILDRLAQNPETFTAECLEKARELQKKGVQLEITDPKSWHGKNVTPRDTGRISIENQLRAEIDDIVLLDRESEAQLARRVEFARALVQVAREDVGMTEEELESAISYSPDAMAGGSRSSTLPLAVRRRWTELHALRTEMVERNLYLVLINVERYAHTSASRLDLIQEGSASLFRAVDGFDWRRGLLFRTYAVHWLNQAFRSYLYNFGNTVRVPVYLQKAMKHIHQAKERLRDPQASVEAIARESGLGENLVESALAASRRTRSIDMPLGDEGDGGNLRDTLSDKEANPYTPELEDVSLRRGIHEALDRLSERERFVLNMRFGVSEDREHTLAEVAERLGVSLERVRQIQVRAITKMRTPKLRKQVDPFLN